MTFKDTSAAAKKINWGDKILPLIFFLAVATMLFRPLLINDIKLVRAGEKTEQTAVQPESTTATATAAAAATPATTSTMPSATTAPTTATAPAKTAAPAAPTVTYYQVLLNTGADFICYILTIATIILVVTGRIGSIAFITFKEAVRNRILYLILFFALILMGSSDIIKELAIGAHDRIIRDFGLACISTFGLLVAISVGISLVYNELDRKTIYTIVSKPVHRWQFLLGKFFGLLLTIYVIVAVMTLFFFTVVNYQAKTTDEQIEKVLWHQNASAPGGYDLVENPRWVQTKFLATAAATAAAQSVGNVFGIAYGAVNENLMIVVVMTCLELMIVTAFVVFYSSFTTPTLSVIFTVMTFLAGRLNEDIIRFAARVIKNALEAEKVTKFSQLSLAVQVKVWFAQIASVVVPNLDSLNLTSEAINQPTMHVWRYPVLYAICYTATILMVAILIFRKRNFK